MNRRIELSEQPKKWISGSTSGDQWWFIVLKPHIGCACFEFPLAAAAPWAVIIRSSIGLCWAKDQEQPTAEPMNEAPLDRSAPSVHEWWRVVIGWWWLVELLVSRHKWKEKVGTTCTADVVIQRKGTLLKRGQNNGSRHSLQGDIHQLHAAACRSILPVYTITWPISI